MAPCLILGDSIAVGVGQARPECHTIAKVGISSHAFIMTMLPAAHPEAATIVISLGVNDAPSSGTLTSLRQVRSRITTPATKVVWLLPGLKPDIRAMIRTVANENGDRTIDTKPFAGRDHLHPTGTGYSILAEETRS